MNHSSRTVVNFKDAGHLVQYIKIDPLNKNGITKENDYKSLGVFLLLVIKNTLSHNTSYKALTSLVLLDRISSTPIVNNNLQVQTFPPHSSTSNTLTSISAQSPCCQFICRILLVTVLLVLKDPPKCLALFKLATLDIPSATDFQEKPGCVSFSCFVSQTLHGVRKGWFRVCRSLARVQVPRWNVFQLPLSQLVEYSLS